MFPYPSGDLHMGHAEAFAMGDVVARYWMLRGYDVLHPIGWDSFGLPAENAAIARDAHPAEWTYQNIDTQRTSFERYAISVDWDTVLHTSDPEYYRWTQWLFLKFYERGLTYRKKSQVNWCPKDQTVLANEQVVDGACERCGTEVTRRPWNSGTSRSPITRNASCKIWMRSKDTGPNVCSTCSATGSANPPVPPSLSRSKTVRILRSTPPDPTRCMVPPSWWSPPTPTSPKNLLMPSMRKHLKPTVSNSNMSPTSTGKQQIAPRPGCSWVATGSTPSQVNVCRCGPRTMC